MSQVNSVRLSMIRERLRRSAIAAIVVLASGAAAMPVQAAVAVDQSPLIIQQPLPPNLVLMLDDSGSMAFNYMPDICYIDGTTGCNSSRRATWSTTPNNDALISSSSNGVYYNPTITYTPPVKVDGTLYPNSPGLTSAWLDGFNPSNSNLTDLTNYTGYSSDNGVNIPLYYSTTDAKGNQYFWFTKGSSGSYTRYYVAASTCPKSASNCVTASDTSGVAAPSGVAAGQNIANWFSYYHTRILMTKSGLMNAFSSVDPKFRVGFGSINNRNKNGLPSNVTTYNSRTIATVQPFGDGSSGTQRAAFWSWLVGIQPGGGTPLRASLDAVGQYYSSAQPWQTGGSGSDSNTELACRQSYTILTTDGFWNGSLSSLPGNKDGTNGTAVSGPNGQSYTYTAALPYSDGNSDTLADVAMKYWSTDLRSTVANEVPPSTEDPAFWQHMTTFTMGLGFQPLYADQSTPIPMDKVFSWALGGAAISNFAWPTPSADSINNIADLAHAAVDGHGGFYSAKTPQALASGLKDALNRAAERVGTGASLAANSTQLKTGTVAYQANYYTSKWKGDLKAFSIDSTTGAIATSPTWTAASALPAAASRVIYTGTPKTTGGKTTMQAVQFVNGSSGAPPSLSTAQLAALGANATDQANMVNYLRGNATLEEKNGGSFRNRDTPLGDIVDSQPVYVGSPDPNQFYTQSFTGTDTFSTYSSNNANRQALIFVAANDGMLHAFNADTGAEVYAYLPGAVVTAGIAQLADPAYGAGVSHQYFNDGELTVADAYFGSAWHTVAVGTTGRGLAKAVYALDITDPANISLLWERSASDGQTNSNYIGQMSGKPVIAQTADGTWSVLIGNGYNSSAGVAALLQFDLSSGSLSVHTTTDTTGNNGLAAPGVWIDQPSSGVSTVAYAGDMHGQVWSFTLNTGTTTATATPSSTGTLLFTATDSSKNVQPITGGMLVGKDPATSNVWVFFGTGRYLSTSDLTDLSTQTWYGLIVQSADQTLLDGLAKGRTNLVQRSIVAENTGSTSPTVVAPARAVSPAPTTSDMSGKSGWYMDLVSPLNGNEGERIVTPNQFQGNLLLATTRIPQATDLCNPSGRGWIMAVSPFTGTGPSSSFFDINGNGTLDAGDSITDANGKTYPAAGIGFSSLPNNPIFVGSSMLVSFDNGTTGSIQTSTSSGGVARVSWRELVNQ